MRFSYTIFKDDGTTDQPVRVNLTTRHEEISADAYTHPFYVEISDNLYTGRPPTIIKSADDWEGWIVGRERAEAWKPFEEAGITIKSDYRRPLTQPIGTVELKPVDGNLKTLAALGKPGISAVPPIAFFAMGAAMQDGVNKYEKYNWREAGATVSVFVDAMGRHLLAYYAGEDHASDSKLHHLAHLMAGCAILLDAELHGKLNDDRLAGNIDPEVIKQFMKLIKKES
jgi:hypothetical protein